METNKNHVCPWWMGYLLLIPLRKLGQDPEKILAPHVKEGMKVLDFGCAMGYFSLPLARLTGEKGIVYCVDLQEKMLEKLQKRARKAGVDQNIRPLLANVTFKPDDLKDQIDFTLLFFVVHEVPDKVKLFMDLFTLIKPGGKILFAEPKGHVTDEEFKKSVDLAVAAGFRMTDEKPVKNGLSALLLK